MRKSSGLKSRYNLSRQKQDRQQIATVLSVGLCVVLVAVPLLEARYGRGLARRTIACLFSKKSRETTGYQSEKRVFSLALMQPEKRVAELEAIANGDGSREGARARYLLASDLIQQQQGQKALDLLEGLECDYSLLGAQAIAKRAQAYQVMGDRDKATAEWENLLKYYPDTPLMPEALVGLGKTKRNDWDIAIAKYPSHPRTLEMARLWLKEKPNQRDLMLLLAKYASDTPGISEVLDKLLALPGMVDGKPVDPLKPEDWEAIAQGYWNDKKYGQASAAYAKAPPTPHNAYLVARGLQLAQKQKDANLAYKKMVSDFSKAKETGTALVEIGKIEPSIEAVPYLERAIEQFPDSAPEALLVKAEALDNLNNARAAAETRQLLLTKYANSDAAAQYRWKIAKAKADAGDYQAALQWAEPILTQSPNSENAREAGFWAGKWAMRLGQKQQAKAIFERVVAQYPQSYYAWRSATFLGWDVGNFNTVREMTPQLALLAERPLLPTGSDSLKELYQLAQDRDAWALWQAEFKNRLKPTVAQQFTDGLLKMAAGDYLSGISEVATLEDREEPADIAEFNSLKQQPIFWYALYPFPYQEIIETWTKKREINPLLVVSLIRQESRFMPNIKSSAGAVGLMQVIPGVAASVARIINLKEYNLENPDDNVNLGTWLLFETHQKYTNNSAFALASYNAGSGNVSKWLKQKEFTDPDEFIENIPFPETKEYVKQVFSNYWNYLRLYDPKVGQLVANSVSQK
ncbi:transglycosylase SLT domain-containing protein [Planktothrix sp. FACHB-1355]|uniref:Transglycosylase SLT domain-containing protein n=1 Tax=Aerosakkonema funiforme FACHB-1375 TaxID=2949571 RepID=A0A926VKI3_9CYAN|nr:MULTISPECIES: transglycosylase SLT domain-containing protein [Oscillatoriales]MBD2184109.1 transglycosylase SLT domain-containing protein [Aerosakkonema funiforme FACHB-1375]MBD3557837.1 transglycosylase SLT domain-containing protein [Planktothrix sp. FACHB-1355]